MPRRIAFLLLALPLLLAGCGSKKTSLFAPTSGSRWTQTSGPSGTSTYAIVSTGNVVLSANQDGIERSTDAGRSWTRTDFDPCYDLLVVNRVLYAASVRGILRSDDGGVSWQSSETGIPAHGRGISLTTRGAEIFASLIDAGVVVTSNGGASWKTRNEGLPAGEYVSAVTYSATLHELFAAVPHDGVWHLPDGEAAWSRLSLQPPGQSVSTLFEHGATLLAGSDRGVFRRVGDGSWDATAGIPSTAYFVGYGAVGSTLFAATPSGLFRSTDDGRHWTALSTPLPEGTPFSAIGTSDQAVFAGTRGAGVVRSTNLGDTWSPAGARDASVASIETLGGGVFVAGGPSGVFSTTDAGAHWQPMAPANNVSCVGVVKQGGALFAGFAPGAVFRSSGGVHWTNVSSSLPPASMVTMFSDGTSVLVSRIEDPVGVYFSTDGSSWSPAVGLPSDPYAYRFAVSEGRLLAGSFRGGLFASTNHGATWAPFGAGLPASNVLEVDANGSDVIVQTTSSSYYSTDGGQNFSLGPLPGLFFQAMAAHGEQRAGITNGGALYHSSDGGVTWTLDEEAPRYGRSVTAGADGWYVGTGLDGVWKSSY